MHTDSPTGSRDSFFLVLSCATQEHWSCGSADAASAYLQAGGIERLLLLMMPKRQAVSTKQNELETRKTSPAHDPPPLSPRRQPSQQHNEQTTSTTNAHDQNDHDTKDKDDQDDDDTLLILSLNQSTVEPPLHQSNHIKNTSSKKNSNQDLSWNTHSE